jgi:hypothetical protein
MATKMKVGVIHKFGQPLTIEEVAVPEPGEGEALVKSIVGAVAVGDEAVSSGLEIGAFSENVKKTKDYRTSKGRKGEREKQNDRSQDDGF